MKKILFILISGIIIAGCEPNEELYKELDKEKDPYSKNVEYTLTESDYSTISGLIPKEDSAFVDYVNDNSFREGFPVNKIVPLFLGERYPALGKSSEATIHYNFIPNYLKKFDEVVVDTLTEVTYSGEEPDEEIPVLLKDSLLPFAPEHKLAQVYYDYEDNYQNDTLTSSFYFLRDGTWEPLPNVYQLTKEDYLSIDGITGDYFLSSSNADKFLPEFLENKFPYADEEEAKVLVYKVNNTIKAKQYILEDGNWFAKVTKTAKFIHSGEKWAFDPTVRYKLKEEDYATILNYVKNDPELSQYVDEQYGNSEYYYGASTYYVNFDTRINVREDYQPEIFGGLSEKEANQIIFRRIVKEAVIIALEAQFPDAVPQVEGVDVYYVITFDAYDGNDDVWTVKYKCTAAGDPPQFEYVEGNTPYEEE